MSSSSERPTARRDLLRSIEKEVQARWETERPFDADAPQQFDKATKNGEKFFATFPYPYMNGVLHLGHAFTLSKAEFAARYQALQGKRVLFPFGFHCTGMPIAAVSDKLSREFIEFGNPPVFPEEDESAGPAGSSSAAAAAAAPKAVPVGGRRAGKGKAAKKKSNKKTQYGILAEMGIAEESIPEFREPLRWLHYFPPIGRDHLKMFGLACDFRRSFITTDANPYYDRFVRWQFETLRRRGDKISFGSRMSVFSPATDQVCADHDRASGEGVGPQEYTLIKLELERPLPAALASVEALSGRRVVLAAATLRPETMYGQTNCWVLPEGEYGVFDMKNGEAYVCTERAALNMSYQEMTPSRGRPTQLAAVRGSDLLGAAVKAPLSVYGRVYVLPLLTISMKKGTGVVTSVPSDAPDDYAALKDLRTKPAMRQKFGLTDEMVLPFNTVDIIEIPGLGVSAAARMCEERKVASQNDRVPIEAIKNEVYLKGFYEGVMLVGPHKGSKVEKAKALIKEQLIAEGLADRYFEPENQVVARSGEECVVALTDQWHLAYGEEEWKKLVSRHVDEVLQTFNPRAKKMFQETVGWLREWACSREYGLGTRLPWDEKYVIESLSDSTIYMAYYTVAHFLQGSLEGDRPGLAGLRPEQVTGDLFNYVFLHDEFPAPPAGVPLETLERMRAEFEYWYPMDLRVSGKDLIFNHLTMALYNHAAVWPDPGMMPRAFFTNGHVLVNKEKMSKSTGNFITMRDAIEQYGADATRLALAEAGDSLNDANFDTTMTNSMILTLTKELGWAEEFLAADKRDSSGAAAAAAAGQADSFLDRVFLNDMARCARDARTEFENMMFHEALKHGFWGMMNARDLYRASVDEAEQKRPLLARYVEAFALMLSPICPHLAQRMWDLLGHKTLITSARWPEFPPVDDLLSAQAAYLRETGRMVRQAVLKAHEKPKKGDPKKVARGVLLYAAQLPEWQSAVVAAMKKGLQETGQLPSPSDLAASLSQRPKKEVKDAMVSMAQLRKEYEAEGARAFELSTPFDEAAVLRDNLAVVLRSVELPFTVASVNDPAVGLTDAERARVNAKPGSPGCHFFTEA